MKAGILLHREDKWNLLQALVLPLVLLIPVLTPVPDDYFWKALYVLTFWLTVNDANFILHQHVHKPLTTSKWLNAIVDLGLGVTTGMSAYHWRQQHVLRHHVVGMRAWGEGTKWEMEKYSPLRVLVYSLRTIVPSYFGPLLEAFVEGCLKGRKAPIDFRVAFAEQLFVAAVVWSLIASQPMVYGTMYLLVHFFTRMTDHENHVGCDDSSKYGFANMTTNKTYNFVRDNFGHHIAHHISPTAHWTELPSITASIPGGVPQDRITGAAWTGITSIPSLLKIVLPHLFGTRSQAMASRAESLSPGSEP